MAAFSGQGVLNIDGTEFPLSEGSVFYFPLRSQILLSSSEKAPLQFYSVKYDYKLIEWEGSALKCSDPTEDRLPLPVASRLSDSDTVLIKMKQLYQLWREKPIDYEWRSRHNFLDILNELREHYALENEGSLARRAIHQSIEYIKTHYDQPLDRITLARQVGLSKGYYSVIFKKLAGCTPTQFITKIRMDQAKHLLQDSPLTIAEIAREVGFQDPLYFTRVFSGHLGISPSEYRKA